MRTFIIKSGDEKTFKDLGKYLRELGVGEKTKGRDYCVVVKQNKPIRSLKANAFFWVVITIYATHTGHTTKEIDYLFRMDRHWEEVEMKSGIKRVPKESHNMDETEYAALINNLLQWGREEFPEVIIPRREDMTYQQWMGVQNEYYKVQSGW
jgi:hypothetical protein